MYLPLAKDTNNTTQKQSDNDLFLVTLNRCRYLDQDQNKEEKIIIIFFNLTELFENVGNYLSTNKICQLQIFSWNIHLKAECILF